VVDSKCAFLSPVSLSYLKAKSMQLQSISLLYRHQISFFFDPAVLLKYSSGQGENAVCIRTPVHLLHLPRPAAAVDRLRRSRSRHNCFPFSLCMTFDSPFIGVQGLPAASSLFVRLGGRLEIFNQHVKKVHITWNKIRQETNWTGYLGGAPELVKYSPPPQPYKSR
jgi:hypothetical protein